MSNIVIQFHSIKTIKQPQVLKDYLEVLLNYAPEKSLCYLHVFKEKHNYFCKLTVHSHIKTFSFDFKHKELAQTLKTVLTNVKNQITDWSKHNTQIELSQPLSVSHLNLNLLDSLKEQTKSKSKNKVYKKSA